jgi:hypothetical protein
MDVIDRDAVFARVFATPDGAALIADLEARGRQAIQLGEIKRRVARARAGWATGTPKEKP